MLRSRKRRVFFFFSCFFHFFVFSFFCLFSLFFLFFKSWPRTRTRWRLTVPLRPPGHRRDQRRRRYGKKKGSEGRASEGAKKREFDAFFFFFTVVVDVDVDVDWSKRRWSTKKNLVSRSRSPSFCLVSQVRRPDQNTTTLTRLFETSKTQIPTQQQGAGKGKRVMGGAPPPTAAAAAAADDAAAAGTSGREKVRCLFVFLKF